MAAQSQRQTLLKLYKSLLRESEKFASYNYRMYAIRRIRDAFKENKCLTTQETIISAVNEGTSTLEIIKRQVIISNLYKADKLVIE